MRVDAVADVHSDSVTVAVSFLPDCTAMTPATTAFKLLGLRNFVLAKP
jgi:hypothetical protein